MAYALEVDLDKNKLNCVEIIYRGKAGTVRRYERDAIMHVVDAKGKIVEWYVSANLDEAVKRAGGTMEELKKLQKSRPAPPPEEAKPQFVPREKKARTHISRESTIHRLVKGNPRKEGTHGFNSFAIITDGMSVREYLEKGGRLNDLAWDLAHAYVELKGAPT